MQIRAVRHSGAGFNKSKSPRVGSTLTTAGRRYVKLDDVSSIQVADETFVAADPAAVGRAVGDRANWRRWFTDLYLDVVEDRADRGVRWTVTGALTGTMEVWLEPVLDGVVLHYFLHAEPTGGSAPTNPATLNHRRRVAGKRMAFEIKNTLEATRPVGTPPRR